MTALIAWKIVDLTKGPKQIRDGKNWESQLDLVWIIIYLNPIAIVSTVFLQSNIFTYLVFFLFFLVEVKRWPISIYIGAFTIFLDYQFGILIVFIHTFFNWRTTNSKLWKDIIFIYSTFLLLVFSFNETNYLKCAFFNVAKINEIGESINPIWYFFVECFAHYVRIFICFFTIYPFVYLLPLVRMTIKMSDYYAEFEKLEHSNESVVVRDLGANNKPLPHKKLRKTTDTRTCLDENH